MGRITFKVDAGIEQQFRLKAMQKFGKQKGFLSKAMAEAINLWTEKEG